MWVLLGNENTILTKTRYYIKHNVQTTFYLSWWIDQYLLFYTIMDSVVHLKFTALLVYEKFRQQS